MVQNPAGSELAFQFNIIENVYQGDERFKAELILTNHSTKTLMANWSIFFNFLRMIVPESVTGGARIQHINGDFFCLEPSDQFKPLAPNTSVTIQFIGIYWVIKASDSPVGFYIVYRDPDKNELMPESIHNLSIGPLTQIKQVVRSKNDRQPSPTPQSRFEKNQNLLLLPKNSLPPVCPTPTYLHMGKGFFQINADHQIAYDHGLKMEAQYLADLFVDILGRPLKIVEGQSGKILLRIAEIPVKGKIKKNGSEAYHLKINAEGIQITGTESAGVYYGMQSLRMLFEPSAYPHQAGVPTAEFITTPYLEIEDAPKFPYRGMHLDVGRNFQKPASIRKLIEMMSLYKLNKFHFHLTDDEGWRIEIPGLPELTEIGGRRGHTYTETECLLPSYGSGPDPEDSTSSGNGYYARSEFIELLKFADRRHIEVIPAIDFPGHARAAVRAMEVRYEKHLHQGNPEMANAYLLTDWEDTSVYESVQMWRRNVVNVGMESTYRFIEKVVEEILAMYTEAHVKLSAIHIGGDEVPAGVWIHSPACIQLMQAHPELEDAHELSNYFLERVNRILESKGLKTAGWEEIALTHKHNILQPNPAFLKHPFIPYVWNTIWGGGGEETVYALANAGYQVIMSNATNLYFDFAYDNDPDEVGYYWGGYVSTENVYKFLPFDLYTCADRDIYGNTIDPEIKYKNALTLSEEGRKNILGIQGQLWGEIIRTPQHIEYLLFPRMIALAERAWATDPDWATIKDKQSRQSMYLKDWNEFTNRIGQMELPRLDRLFEGVLYRIPPPGAKLEKGILSANVEFPGLEIRYTTDETEPSIESMLYTNPIRVTDGMIKLKTFTTTGRSSRTSVIQASGSKNQIDSEAQWQKRIARMDKIKK